LDPACTLFFYSQPVKNGLYISTWSERREEPYFMPHANHMKFKSSAFANKVYQNISTFCFCSHILYGWLQLLSDYKQQNEVTAAEYNATKLKIFMRLTEKGCRPLF
jgi:hypothetical protein